MKWNFIALSCIASSLFADNTDGDTPEEMGYEPLYAGTLLATYAENTDPGRFSIQPYLSVVRVRGSYDGEWQKSGPGFNAEELYIAFSAGLTSFLDVNLNVYGQYTQSSGGNTWGYGDTELQFGTQVCKDKKGEWSPDIRLLIGEVFPTGKYENLNPKKNGADVSGAGTYSTQFILSLRKVFYSFPKHPFNVGLNLFYVVSTKTKVHGINVYQGGKGAAGTSSALPINGVIDPGNQLIVNLSSEFSFTRYLAIGMDAHYSHTNRPHFKGEDPFGTGSFVSSEQFSLAPCLEYNFNENLSVELASWFTVAGRNANDFVSGTATVFFYF